MDTVESSQTDMVELLLKEDPCADMNEKAGIMVRSPCPDRALCALSATAA